MLGLFKCCVASHVLIQLQFYVLCNCFPFLSLICSLAELDLIFMVLLVEYSTSFCAQLFPSYNVVLLLGSAVYRSQTGSLFDVRRIRSQIWQWPFHAMFISLVTMRFFLAQFRFFILVQALLLFLFFSFHFVFFVDVFFSHFLVLLLQTKSDFVIVAVALSLSTFFRSWVQVSLHDASFIVYVSSSKFWWKKAPKAHFR